MPSLAAAAEYFRASEEMRWYSNGGPCSRLLTERVSARVGGLPCVLVGNATLGLMVAARALAGAGRGRYAVLPSYTFVATVEALQWVGLRPLFVDIDRSTWHPDVGQIRQACRVHGDDIALLVGCSTFGTAPPAAAREELRSVAEEHRIPLLVDSAAGFGSQTEDGTWLGNQGDAEIFSFHATKPFAIGEGGVVVCRDDAVADAVGSLANFGFGADRTVVRAGGLNAKLDELHCALGLALLDEYDEVLAQRRSRAVRIQRGVIAAGLSVQEGSASSAFQFVPVLSRRPGERDETVERAHAAQVEFRTYFSPALHQQKAFKAAARFGDLRVTDDVAARSLSLPLANDLSDDAIDLAVELASP